MIWIVIAVFIGGIAVAIVAYRQLINRLERHHPQLHAMTGNIAIFNRDAQRSLQLQKLIYSMHPEKSGDVELLNLCRFLRVYTPLLVVGSICGVVIVALTLAV